MGDETSMKLNFFKYIARTYTYTLKQKQTDKVDGHQNSLVCCHGKRR